MSHPRRLKTLQHVPSARARAALGSAAKSPLERWKANGSRLLEDIRCHTETASGQQVKDELFNRNITHFRDSFRANDSAALPFLSSLRSIKDYRQEYQQTDIRKAMGLTSLQPFEAGAKSTHNQLSRKQINDMKANAFRLSKINYRWQNRSGLGVKNSCEFECTLRLGKDVRNPEESTFFNTIEPIRYCKVEKQRYQLKELICQRQKRLFTLKH